MPNIQKRVIEKDLHPQAREAIKEYSVEFTDAVLLQSKTIATVERADEVQSLHVTRAREMVLSAGQSKSRLRDSLLLIGSLGLGIAIQGIIGEYSSPTPRPNYFVFYFIIGILSAILTLWGISKK